MDFHYPEQSSLEIFGVFFINTLEQSNLLMELIHTQYFIIFF